MPHARVLLAAATYFYRLTLLPSQRDLPPTFLALQTSAMLIRVFSQLGDRDQSRRSVVLQEYVVSAGSSFACP